MDKLNLNILDDHPKDAVKLFKTMMRFEFALKELGFIYIYRNENVGVNWDRFANESLTSSFYEKIKSSNLANTLIKNPPSHQREEHGSLSFIDADSPTDVQTLIGAVCRVRNNLFHGGKSGDKDQDRNNELISDALEVINEAVVSREDLKAIFEGRS
ncbi:hypothetical protein N9M10_01130 [Hellea sp.]|nr:hypothetical protein [Hellea sp.]